MQLAAIAMTLLIPVCAGAADPPGRTLVVPAGQERAYDEWHYAPAVRSGNTVYVSGIPAARGATYEEKVRNMFERLRATLAAAGAQMSDVVELQSFHAQAKDTASFDEEFARFSKIHAEYFPDRYPAWTAVGTTALLADGAVVEMRATAVVGSGRNARVQRADAKKP